MTGDRAQCRHCHQRIIEVPDVGWLDPDGGDTYDLCPVDRYGNHEPDPRHCSSQVQAHVVDMAHLGA